MNRSRRISAFCLALAIGASAAVPAAEATVIERIVAVVGDRAILLSDLRKRAEPFLVQVHQSVPPGAQRNAAISQLYRSLIERIVDEELELRAAQQSKLTVSAKEIDDALERVAAQNKLTVADLVAEATRSGLSEAGYRDELRRQLLEAKLINVRLQGRIRVTDEDLRLAYRKLVIEERQRLAMTPAWIVLELGESGAEQREQRALAERISEQGRGGDFAELARRHSVDAASRNTGGALRRMRPGELSPALARTALALDVGEVSSPIRVGRQIVVLKVVEREPSQLPEFADARRELAERVYVEKMSVAKKTWLDGLRRQHHVEIRL